MTEAQIPAEDIDAVYDEATDAFDAGKLRRARDLYRKVLEAGEGDLDDEIRMVAREALGMCYYRLKNFGEAERCDRKSLMLLENASTASGPDSEQVTRIRHNLARDLSAIHDTHASKTSKLEEALLLHRQNLEARRISGNIDDLWETQSSLAFDLSKFAKTCKDDAKARGVWQEAAAIGRDLTDTMKPMLEETDDNRLIEARHNYASVLFDLKRFQQAKDLFLVNEAVLQTLGSSKTDARGVTLPSIRRYLEACNEATMDLGASLSRRSTDLRDGSKTHSQDKAFKQGRPTITTTAATDSKSRSENDVRRIEPETKRSRHDQDHSSSKDSLLVPTTTSFRPRKPKSDERLGSTTRASSHRARSASDAGLERRDSVVHRRSLSPKESRSQTSVSGRLFQEFSQGHDSDRWFAELWKHSHGVLSYDDCRVRRRRVRVAILDSGLDRPEDKSKQRPDIRRHRYRLQEYMGYKVSDDWVDTSTSKHGTNCASLLLQVAPQADLYVANVVSPDDGKPSASLVSNALQWALEREVDIISMSLGFDNVHDDISNLIDTARQKKVLVFAAASNDGDFDQAHGVFPAWLPTVFCIKSTKAMGIASDFNPQLTMEKANFMFLGEDIQIAGAPDVPRLNGNSFATPIAAGTAAMVLDVPRIVKNANKEHPRVERLLRTYEGMSAVFKAMSGETSPGRLYYHVRPWLLLCEKDRAPGPEVSNEWNALVDVAEGLGKRFGKVWGKIGDS
ncbi:Putative peptidase S8/S53 domain, tetratricopeptide-like helical domain superfamily [Septoria linicola]|uniref:Peptidase S8/S53 domain, tetratricopeptide-like helical domain superfamily n=1 Tax=Septoria linicola TaxID=215465 RepID=A0A9Q9EK52_9PEZI|nr:putative peptidase S8/S53 domain, tetratricopeptide-like helical domain superfamily [Septoria linicola]USW52889.1 Putative peptidase S8/S53 domain, tetratricopeptide-like helical domain superfamily [Septoria linicola]